MKELKNPKSCERCRALVEAQGEPMKCYLNYRMDNGIPLEPCPKPLTISQFIRLTPGSTKHY